jgi:hypothetical protein
MSWRGVERDPQFRALSGLDQKCIESGKLNGGGRGWKGTE